MKKRVNNFAVILAAVFLTGCQNDIEPAPDITSSIEDGTNLNLSETIEIGDISVSEAADSGEEVFIPRLLLETDKPFVLAEERYLIEKRELKADDAGFLHDHIYRSCFADNKCYYSESGFDKSYYEHTDREHAEKASILAYDFKTGEHSPLYSEAPSSDANVLVFDIVGLHDNFLYYFRKESPFGAQALTGVGFDLCRLNLEDKKSEHIFSLNNEWFWECKDDIAIVGDSLYFYDFHDANSETYECVRIIRRFDTDTGEVSVFRDDAENVMHYKNGIIYFHDGGYYYHGEDSDIKGKGIFYEGDELIFYFDSEEEPGFIINAKGDIIFYCYAYYTDEGGVSGIGIYDEDFNRVEIAATKKGTWTLSAGEGCMMSETGLISAGRAPKPLIYDMRTESFAIIPIDDYSDYLSYAEDDGICFLGYDTDDDLNYISAALYTVKRR